MPVTNRTYEPARAGDPAVADPAVADPAVADRADGDPAVADRAAGDPAAGRTAVRRTAVAEERAASPRRGWRRRRATTAVAAAGAGTSLLLARIVRLITAVVGLILALGIVFVLLKASPTNTIVSHVHDWAHWLATPFNGLFHLHSARGTTALNWGIALVVYVLVGHLIARFLSAPHRAWRRREAVA